MADLSLIIVVPQHLQNDRQIGVAAETVATSLQLACGIKVKYEVVPITGADGKVYDNQFRIIRNEIDPNDVVELAAAVAGTKPRKRYVIFLSREIVRAQDGALVPSGIAGFTISDRAVSCIAIQESKSTIGNRDGQTWTHEIGHGLGLRHTDGNDEENLMHPSRHGDSGRLIGFKLSETQQWTLIRFCEALAEKGI